MREPLSLLQQMPPVRFYCINVQQLDAEVAESNAQARVEARQREAGVEALGAVGVGALMLDMLMPGGGLSSHTSMFVTLDMHGLHTLYAPLSGHKQFLKTKQRVSGSSSSWSWQQRVLFVLVRVGGGLGSACKPSSSGWSKRTRLTDV